MIKDIRLFISGKEIDFQKTPDILYNYTEDDLANPTIVKNSFSKSITIDGTANNNKVFGQFWNNEREIGLSGFNPAKKAPFELYVNNELYESGYCRLDSVTNGTYSITLFGGLGDFFYNLSYNDSNEGDEGQKKLSDLHFIEGSNSADEFDFKINKELVQEAWNELEITGNSKWQYINFMPSYDGIPSDFDADKVLINFENTDLQSQYTTGTTAYTAYDGYALGTMAEKHTADEMREFRSYLMRPVINVRKVIEACCKAENNGGYSVDLDPDFFNEHNPYWTDTWATLPLLTSYDNLAVEEATGITATLGAVYDKGGYTARTGYNEYRNITLAGESYNKDNAYSVSMDIDLIINNLIKGGAGSSLPDKLYPNYFYDPQNQYASCIVLQLVAYNSLGTPVAGSDAINITSEKGPGYYTNIDLWGYSYPYGNKYVNSIGAFEKIGSTKSAKWNKKLSLTINNVPYGATVKLILKKYGAAMGYYGQDYGFELNTILWGQMNGTYIPYSWSRNDNFEVSVNEVNVSFMGSNGVRTGTLFKKANLLDTDYSPADFLLSYCKQFGLYFNKDVYEKKIYIRTRDTFYRTGDTMNLNEIIDRSNMGIQPVLMDSKWADFKLEKEECDYGKKYEDTYGVQFGIQRINTGYDFNAEVKDLLEGNIFHSGIEVAEKNECYSYFDDDSYKPWMLQGYSYLLYESGGTENTYEVKYGEESTIGVLQGFSKYKYYDLFPKLQFHTSDGSPSDGSRVIVFYRGKVRANANDVRLKYWLTDDNADMFILNDANPCWLYTNSTTDKEGKVIALEVEQIPHFGRYMMSVATGNINRSLDFGEPKQLFIPWANTNSGSTIYSQYWKNYIGDIYNANTRVLTTKVKVDGKIDEDWFRRFYWFDNSIWRLNKITDHNLADDNLTEMEFVKVQDKQDYQLIIDYITDTFTVSTDAPEKISPEGGTYTLTISASSENADWYLDYEPDEVTPSVTAGTGSAVVTIVVASNATSEHPVGSKTIKVIGETDSAAITLYQYLGSLLYSLNTPTGNTIPQAGTTVRIDVYNRINTWSASCNQSVTWQTSGGTIGSSQMVAVVPANIEHSAKSIEFYITNGAENVTITYTQDRNEPVLTVSPSAQTIDSAGNISNLSVEYNHPNPSLTITKPNWISASWGIWRSRGNGMYYNTLYLDAEPNTNNSSRSGSIIISDGEISNYSRVTQSAAYVATYRVYYLAGSEWRELDSYAGSGTGFAIPENKYLDTQVVISHPIGVTMPTYISASFNKGGYTPISPIQLKLLDNPSSETSRYVPYNTTLYSNRYLDTSTLMSGITGTFNPVKMSVAVDGEYLSNNAIEFFYT